MRTMALNSLVVLKHVDNAAEKKQYNNSMSKGSNSLMQKKR